MKNSPYSLSFKMFSFSYKHAVDGVIRLAREEGITMWMRGVTMTSTRGLLITSTQVRKFCYIYLILHIWFFGKVTDVRVSGGSVMEIQADRGSSNIK